MMPEQAQIEFKGAFSELVTILHCETLSNGYLHFFTEHVPQTNRMCVCVCLFKYRLTS